MPRGVRAGPMSGSPRVRVFPAAATSRRLDSTVYRAVGLVIRAMDQSHIELNSESLARTFQSVKGFGEVQTRDWVECRATQRSLILGSFSLGRVRGTREGKA
jgi:hypothetical protein